LKAWKPILLMACHHRRKGMVWKLHMKNLRRPKGHNHPHALFPGAHPWPLILWEVPQLISTAPHRRASDASGQYREQRTNKEV
jgi:hypothetical protein